jgi:urea transporter
MFSKELYNDFRQTILPGILNSYSIVFFLNNKLLAIVLIIISFFNFFAGLSGLYAVLLTLFIAYSMNIDKKFLRTGVYSFNGLLTGIGMGTFFDPGFVFFSLLTLVRRNFLSIFML